MTSCEQKVEKFKELEIRISTLKQSFETKPYKERNKTDFDDFIKDLRELLKIQKEVKELEKGWLPEGGIYFDLITDPSIQTPEEAERKLEEKGIYITDYAKDLIQKTEFSKNQEIYNTVQFTVEQLGFPKGATTVEIYKKAQDLGLKLCPPEVGPQLRLAYKEKDWKLIAMKPISGRHGDPYVFHLYFDDDKLTLDGGNARPSRRWDSDDPFVFRFRK